MEQITENVSSDQPLVEGKDQRKNVITSYSIHYTKLYESAISLLISLLNNQVTISSDLLNNPHQQDKKWTTGITECMCWREPHRTRDSLSSSGAKSLIRITSYNVCYTKLLRMITASSRRPSRPRCATRSARCAACARASGVSTGRSEKRHQ